MTRTAVGLLLLSSTVTLSAQTQPAAPPSYYSQKTQASAPTQPIRRVAGEAPVVGEPPARPPGGNVISQPPATIPANGANPTPPANPRPNAGGTTQPLQQPQQFGPQLPNAQPPRPTGPMMPPGFPLDPQQEKQVDQLLQQWQMQSGQIKHFKCTFQCWEYDPVFGPKDKAKVFSSGQIAYETPDKGMFKETESRVFSAAKKEGEEAGYTKQADENLKHWVCDGQNVFEFDARKKELVQRVLPPEMQGKAIADGPLPFLFGAEAAKMKARYWIRPIEKEGVKDGYALEAIPKRATDAANFRVVHIVLDAKTFLPQYLELYPPNYDPKQNPARATYAFSNVEKNWNKALAALNIWNQNFFAPKLPSGWKKVVEDFSKPPGGGPAGGTVATPERPTTVGSRPLSPTTPGTVNR